MHGIIFNQFFKFIRETRGFETLSEIQKSTKFGSKFYDATKAHSDSEMEELIQLSVIKLNLSREELLERFGEFVLPILLHTYRSFIDPQWTNSIDMLSMIEHVMHRSVRTSNPNASPPKLKIKRLNVSEVEIEYYSERNMGSFGIGLIKGIGKHYNEVLVIKTNRLGGGASLLIKVSKR